MSYKLFLDDERDPIGTDWIIAVSYDAAVAVISSLGCPEFISFDHDLGEGKTGYDFTKFLVGKDLECNGMFIPDNFKWVVHSQNPVGTSNINKYLQQYMGLKHKE